MYYNIQAVLFYEIACFVFFLGFYFCSYSFGRQKIKLYICVRLKPVIISVDQTILIVLKGLLIGILVSAPMGPVGVLCIQRTLNKGRWHGLATGVGAMLSDVLYAMMVGMGMSFILAFVTQFQSAIQIFGSALLLLFGLVLFRSNPIRSFRQQKKNMSTYTQDLVTAFLITLSNPLIIFLFVGLFARLNLYNNDFSLWQHLIVFFSIALGAFIWWLLVTSVFSKLRNRFNLRKLWVVNRIIASVVIGIAALGIAYTALDEIGNKSIKGIGEKGIQILDTISGSMKHVER